MRKKFNEPPLILRYKKPHSKFKFAGSGNINKIIFTTKRETSYTFISTEYGKISLNELETIRRLVLKEIKKAERGCNFNILVYPNAPVMGKPVLVRMGSGKGSRIKKWVCFVKPGKALFEVENCSKKYAASLFKTINRRFSLKLNFFLSNELV